MTDFRFADTMYLSLLPVLALCWLALSQLGRHARARLAAFLSEANLSQLLVNHSSLRSQGKTMAFWLGLALMALALARPQANPTVEEMPASGLDIYVLLDVSRSMDAEDVAPSRIKKAKRTIHRLASRLAGDRLGVIAFAQSAALVIPLTSDYSVLESYLRNVDSSMIPSQGTNLGGALLVAKEAMDRGAKSAGGEDRSNIFLVLSDGEDHGESDLSIVDRIRGEGGVIFSIAYGTERGVPIPVRNEKGELLPDSYKRNRRGEIVITSAKTGVLEEVAKRGGGHFYFSTVEDAEVEDILARVNQSQRGSYSAIRTTVYEELYWAFLAPGLALLLFSFLSVRGLLARIPLPAPRLPGRKSAAVLLLFLPLAAEAGPLSLLWSKEKQASDKSNDLAKDKKFAEAVDALKTLQAENPDSPELSYNIGTYLLNDKKSRQGREQLDRLRSESGPLRELALFNSAGSFALEGKKDEARAEYAELIQRLGRKPNRSKAEEELLSQAKRNVARLADPSQQPPPPQSEQSEQKQQGGDGGEGKQDQKGDQKQNQKQEQKGDGKTGEGDQGKNEQKPDDKGQQDKDGDNKKGEGDEKKQEAAGGDKPQDTSKNQAPQGMRQPFRERDGLGEEEARRILGALKEQESSLQKNFLKKQLKGGRVNTDDADQDW